MNVPALGKVESLLLIGTVAALGYFGWQAYKKAQNIADATGQAVGDLRDSVVNVYHKIGETVADTVNDAQQGMVDVLGSPGAMLGVSSSQLALYRQQAEGAGNAVGRAIQAAGDAELASQELGTRDDFIDASARMAKPGYDQLNTPSSLYPQ